MFLVVIRALYGVVFRINSGVSPVFCQANDLNPVVAIIAKSASLE